MAYVQTVASVCADGYKQTLHNFVCKKLGIPSSTCASNTRTPQLCECNLAFLYILNAADPFTSLYKKISSYNTNYIVTRKWMRLNICWYYYFKFSVLPVKCKPIADRFPFYTYLVQTMACEQLFESSVRIRKQFIQNCSVGRNTNKSMFPFPLSHLTLLIN